MFCVPLLFPLPGLPKPVIRWLRNGQELTGNEPGVTILEDGTLLILASVSPLDDGEYVCAAVNDAGSTERKYQLKVNGDSSSSTARHTDSLDTEEIVLLIPCDVSAVPPDFRDSNVSGNLSVVLNQPTTLFCDVTGSPTPVVTWYKDGSPVGDIQFVNVNADNL